MKKVLLGSFAALLLAGCNVEIYPSAGGIVKAPAAAKCDKSPQCLSVDRGTALTLEAVPYPGYRFEGWAGVQCGNAPTCNLTVPGNLVVEAIFRRDGVVTSPRMDGGITPFAKGWPNEAFNFESNGTPRIKDISIPKSVMADGLKKIIAETPGWSTSGAVLFQFDNPLATENLRGVSLPAASQNGFYVNLDDPHDIVPATLRGQTRVSSDWTQQGLVALEVMPGLVLKPSSRYAAVLLAGDVNGIRIEPSPLMSSLESPNRNTSTLSTAEFSALAAQWSHIKSAIIDSPYRIEDIAAFSVFKTQNPLALDQAIGRTLSGISDQQIIDSVVSVTRENDFCLTMPTDSQQYRLVVNVPNFMAGSAPYFFAGGEISVTGGMADIKSWQALSVGYSVPCSASLNSNPIPLFATAMGTGDSWYTRLYPYVPFATITISSPGSADRYWSYDNVIAPLQALGLYVEHRVLNMIAVDMNIFNLPASVGLHHQYGAELSYITRLGKLMPQVLSKAGQSVPVGIQTPYSYVNIGGVSLGGLASVHSIAQGNVVDGGQFAWIPRVNHGVSQDLLKFFETDGSMGTNTLTGIASKLIGISKNEEGSLLYWLFDSAMSSLDTANYLELVKQKPFIWSVGPPSDPLHGSQAAYDLTRSMRRHGVAIGAIDRISGDQMAKYVDSGALLRLDLAAAIDTNHKQVFYSEYDLTWIDTCWTSMPGLGMTTGEFFYRSLNRGIGHACRPTNITLP